jgi:hypothetical protein
VAIATALAGAGVFSVVATADTEIADLGTLGAAVFGVPGALFAVSAVHGFSATAECRARYDRLEERNRRPLRVGPVDHGGDDHEHARRFDHGAYRDTVAE